MAKSATSDDPVSTISSSVTALDVDPVEELSDTQQKRKHVSTESDDFEIRKKSRTADMFQFSKQGICEYGSIFKPGHLGCCCI